MAVVQGHWGMGVGRSKPSQRDDDHLIKAYARGDSTAFDELYVRFSEPLFGYLYNATRNDAIANELFQDVWLRLIASAHRYKPNGRFRSWLFTLAHNRVVDYYRSAGRMVMADGEPKPYEEMAVEREVEGGEQQQRIAAALDTMPLEQRTAFLLREEAGLSVREIAEIQAIAPEAAKSRLRYAYQRLREVLGNAND